MAGNIRGITIEFRGDTTKLDKALRQINNETKAIDRELRQVDKALKFNPTSVDLWKQKQELLKKKISETKEKLALLKDEQARMDAEGVDKNSEEYRKLQREIIEAESKTKHYEQELRKIGNVNLRATSEQFKQLGDNLTKAGNAMSGLSKAAAVVEAAIAAVTYKSAKWADDVNTLSKKYSIGTDKLQMYSAAANLVDTDVEAITKSHIKLERSMYSAQGGTGAAAETFKKLGVEVTNADGSLRDSDAVWQDTISALGGMTNETERDAYALQLMGKSAADLNPLIEDGGEAYKNLAETMQKYGLDFIDQETLDNANKFNDELDTIKAIGQVTFQTIGTQLASYLAPALEKVVDWVGKLASWLSQLSPQTQTIIATIAGVIAVAAPLLLGLGKLSFAISSIISLIATIGPAIGAVLAAAGPVVLIIGAIIAAGVLLYKNWDKIKEFASQVWEHVKTVFDNLKNDLLIIWNGIKAAAQVYWNLIKAVIINPVKNAFAIAKAVVGQLRSALSTAWAGIKSAATTAWNAVKNAITNPIKTAHDAVKKIVGALKKLFPINVGNIFKNVKLPHFNWTWKAVGNTKLKVPSFSGIDWHKKGAIFTRPTLLPGMGGSIHGVGDVSGGEAVLPLDTFWKKMDRIAEAAAVQNEPIVVNVYGSDNMSVDELAAAVEQRIIQMQKRRTLAWR